MKTLAVGALAATMLLGTACSPDESDFKNKAAEVVSDEIRQQLDLDSEVDCEAPASTDVGTKFTCAAEAADGTRYTFNAEITGDSNLTVTLAP